jgi:hypothetical protein
MPQSISLGNDIKGFNTGSPIPSTLIYSAVLAIGSQSLTIPGNSSPQFKNWEMYITNSSDIYVSFDGDITIPVGNSFLQTNTVLNPKKRVVKAGDIISFQPAGYSNVIYLPDSINVGQNSIVTTNLHDLVSSGDAFTFTSTGTLPGGIVAGTYYYAIPFEKTGIQVASSIQNAQNNSSISLTSTGTGYMTMTGFLPSNVTIELYEAP